MVNSCGVGFYPTGCDCLSPRTWVLLVADGGVEPHPTLSAAGEERAGEGVVSGAGGMAGVPGGDEDAVVAGGGGGRCLRSRNLRRVLRGCCWVIFVLVSIV